MNAWCLIRIFGRGMEGDLGVYMDGACAIVLTMVTVYPFTLEEIVERKNFIL